MQDQVAIAAAGVVTFVGVVALVPIARRLALKYGVTDRPAAGKLHTSPTPYLGGVAIAIAVAGASSLVPRWSAQVGVLVLGALIVATAGLVDDVRTLGPILRVVIECLAAALLFVGGIRVHLVGDAGDFALTIGWLVILTNSFNLLDNMDGAAGAIVCTIAGALLTAALLQGQVLVGGLAAVVVAGCLGFLVHNWHPARIFMGDAGSLFLGFLLSAIALKLRFAVRPPASVVAVGMLVGAALFDTTLVVVSRVRAGRPIYIGGTDHTSHRLLRLGMGTTSVAAILACGSGLSAALGVAVGRGVLPAGLTAVLYTTLAVVALARLLQADVVDQAPLAISAVEGDRGLDAAMAAVSDPAGAAVP